VHGALAAGQERFEHGDDFPDEQKADVDADEAADQRENDGRFHRRFDVSQNRREPRPNSGDGGSHINEPFRHGRIPPFRVQNNAFILFCQ